MKERINKLARGIVELDKPELKLSDESFKGTVNAGELAKFELILYSENGILLKGLIYSDNPNVTVQKDAFGGIRSRIKCNVDTRKLKDGDKVEGQLYIVSNGGEVQLPYSFDVRSSYRSGEIISGIHTKEDYINLCNDNEELALRVFDYCDFQDAEFMQDSRLFTIYQGLKSGQDRSIAHRQFLIALQNTADRKTDTSKETLLEAAKKTAASPKLQDVFALSVEDKPLIEKAAGICIREGATDKMAFDIYQRAIEMGSTITRLYEYYIYAMPKGWDGKLPREVYLYFAYEKVIEENMKLPLFYNILVNFDDKDDIYQRFEHKIQSFAIDKLLRSEFDQRLSVIYDRMILSDMIDERIASVLPAILRSYRITTDDKRMSFVVIKYRELDREEVYALKDGVAYVPVFFENSEILFQDVYGNRYIDVKYDMTRIMHKESLEKKCFEILPEHAMLKLSKARSIAKSGIDSINQLRLVEQVVNDMDISRPYRLFLQHAVLSYHDDHTRDSDKSISDMDIDFLRSLDIVYLSHEDIDSLLRTYIKLNLFKEAYEIVLETGEPDIKRQYLEKLCRAIIEDEKHGRSKEVMMLALQIFQMGTNDKDIIRFLLKEYNGLSRDMLAILRRGRKTGVDASDMTERLLAQMIFSWTEDGLDEVYHIYREQPSQQNILIRAYITKRCIDYFIYGQKISDDVFSDVFGIIRDERYKDRVPMIYLLAMSKHMAENKKLTGEEKLILQDVMDILIQKKMIFQYTRTLSDVIRIPDFVMDKYYIEYHGDKTIRPSLYMRILPDEHDFEEEEISRVYQNIYVRPVTLFTREKAEYQIYDETKGNDIVMSGTIKADNSIRLKGDTFDILNEMSGLLGQDNDRELREVMLRYVRNESVIEELFTKELTETKDKEQ
ncbi:DUF5717 family protein [Oribacterium sp. WCC10]|uniref:DUF5717 family protein n=1 Tax=Oribacterium sp. WCC10 TaxID=1855343 RepID=UPI0008F36C3B|nr:DUF5717 family protein [Oribacterium sp. WCC10]SFG19440.1 hypothetical protein SAMN05216356_10374 [Oribacterium sp. WCC10]